MTTPRSVGDVPHEPTIPTIKEAAPSLEVAARFDFKRWLFALSFCVILMGAQLAGLKSLPYASCFFEHSASTDDPAPERSGFHVGSVSWDLPVYLQASKLKPFRDFYRVNCEGTTGIAAAVCVSNVFARRFPLGAARQDFCDRSYDPAATLSFQLKGNPGHCMQRSGLLAAVLLSNGIPARVIQILSPQQGHTLVEVWAGAQGWTLLDPSMGCVIGVRGRPFSAITLLRSSGSIQAYAVGEIPAHSSSLASFYGIFGPARDLNIVYPEPWLYLRIGPRFSSWPFRGRYMTPNKSSWRYGLGQRLYIVGILISFFAVVVSAVVGARAVLHFRYRRPFF